MATYKEISGLNIKTLSADPSNLSEGDMWYNTTSRTLKTAQPVAAAWASAPNLNQARNYAGTLGATYDTSVIVHGNFPPASPNKTLNSEEYNGSTWSATNPANTASAYGAGSGTGTAGIVFCGNTAPTVWSTATENWDGTNWTTGTPMGASHYAGGMFGQSQTSAVVFGGGTAWPSVSNINATTEEWNGSAWASVSNYNPGNLFSAHSLMAGVETAGVAGMAYPGQNTTVQEYDGTSWTAATSAPVGSEDGGSIGSQTDALVFGGNPGFMTTSTAYDGTNWTAAPSLTSGGGYGNRGTSSNTTAGGIWAGWSPAPRATTEEYQGIHAGAKTVTTS